MVRAADRPVLALDDPSGAPGTVAQAGVDPTLDGRALQDAFRSAIATRRGYCSWAVDHAGCTWVVTLHSPEEQDFSSMTLEEALASCLVWLMVPEFGGGVIPKGLRRRLLGRVRTRDDAGCIAPQTGIC